MKRTDKIWRIWIAGFVCIMLWMSPALAKDKEQIRQVQLRLQAQGYHPGPVDGIMGSKTGAAICKYQNAQGLPVTGILDAATFRSFYRLEYELDFGEYLIRIYRDKNIGSQSFDIWKNGRQIYSAFMDLKDHGLFEISDATVDDDEKISNIAVGEDITGDGQPNLIIRQWTGGAHCCIIYHLFQVGKVFRDLGTIYVGHGEPPSFKNLDEKPGLELVVRDWTFAYWRTGFANSIAPELILHFRDGTYRLAADLMRKPAPTAKEIANRAEIYRKSLQNKLPLSSRIKKHFRNYDGGLLNNLWEHMTGLIYTGHADPAWQYVEMAWPPSLPNKKEILDEFRSRLESSRYWQDLFILNKGKL